ncbi:hypothetical protein BGZ97_009518 [Linnemannia gamsii]|uniref:Uncharacterized protein n=1 Tax=Linnemannia gamsii TaxID=64522 RepID=A0A9P6UVV1_9FUNG|nr:hypothetical protein BGZ97_009518 [Linnemannia gamsii]
MLDYIPLVANISFGIMIGDIPPYDSWLETPEKTIPRLKAVLIPWLLSRMFPTPKSEGDIAWLYDTLADDRTR